MPLCEYGVNCGQQASRQITFTSPEIGGGLTQSYCEEHIHNYILITKNWDKLHILISPLETEDK